MSTSPVKMLIPADARGHAIQRAMGLPIPLDSVKLGSAAKYVDVYDLTDEKYAARAFTGLSVTNPSGASKLYIAMGGDFSENRVIIIDPLQFFTFDNLTFGPGVFDDSEQLYCTKIRAKLQLATGVFASATIGYGVSGNPTNGMTVNVNGKLYEFSSDKSIETSNDYIVDIKATADLTWSEFLSIVNSKEQAVTVSIDTGTDIVTVTSNYGGDYGNGLVVADGGTPTGAVFSGNLAGGSGGLAPTFHIW